MFCTHKVYIISTAASYLEEDMWAGGATLFHLNAHRVLESEQINSAALWQQHTLW